MGFFSSKSQAIEKAAELISIERPEIKDLLATSNISAQELINLYLYIMRVEPRAHITGML
jgi:hypothetical protein